MRSISASISTVGRFNRSLQERTRLDLPDKGSPIRKICFFNTIFATILKSMRVYTFLLVTICLCFGCESKVKSNLPKSEDPLLKSIEIPTNEKGEIINSEMPQLNLLENKIDFGTVEAGKTYTRQLKFTNNGKANLLISEVSSSCGCTVPRWPKNYIVPGDSSEIIVEYNGKDKQGYQEKVLTIYSNTNPVENTIKIIANIKSKI